MIAPNRNGWTGGQYALFRFALGAYLSIHFLHLMFWGPEVFSDSGMLPHAESSPLTMLFPNVLAIFDAPWMVTLFLGCAAIASVSFALGVKDRPLAIGLWYVWACLLGRNPLISNPGLPYVGWMLLAHAALPSLPGLFSKLGFGVRDREPWRMPHSIFTVAWILMAAGYSFSGWWKLDSPSWIDGSALWHVLNNPLVRPGVAREFLLALPPGILKGLTWSALGLELFFAPLALFRKARPWLWGAMLAMHLSLITLIDFADLSLGMVMLHCFTFNPMWIPARKRFSIAEPIKVFYDGHCGLCHRFVRFVLSEERFEGTFRFAPLGGDAFQTASRSLSSEKIPDSIAVMTQQGRLLFRSAAVVNVFEHLGGIWRLIAFASCIIPQNFADKLYDVVARSRRNLFSEPPSQCPILAPALRSRFESV